MRVRFRFMGDLPSAVTAVIDPHKLTWIQETQHDLERRVARFRLLPDHYASRLACQGTFRIVEQQPGSGASVASRRHITGELRVQALLVASKVEGAIVSGLAEYLNAECGAVDKWIQGNPRT